MTDALRAQFRQDILKLVDAANGVGLSARSVHTELRISYPQAKLDEDVKPALAYLAGKGLIEERKHDVSPNLNRFAITPAGADHCESERS